MTILSSIRSLHYLFTGTESQDYYIPEEQVDQGAGAAEGNNGAGAGGQDNADLYAGMEDDKNGRPSVGPGVRKSMNPQGIIEQK